MKRIIITILTRLALIAALIVTILTISSIINKHAVQAAYDDHQAMLDSCAGMIVEEVKQGVTVCYPRGTDLGRGIKSNWKPQQ